MPLFEKTRWEPGKRTISKFPFDRPSRLQIKFIKQEREVLLRLARHGSSSRRFRLKIRHLDKDYLDEVAGAVSSSAAAFRRVAVVDVDAQKIGNDVVIRFGQHHPRAVHHFFVSIVSVHVRRLDGLRVGIH